MQTVIAWVLVIGFTITLAAVVRNWGIEQALEIDPEKITRSELYCDNVRLSIADFNCTPTLNSLTIRNNLRLNLI